MNDSNKKPQADSEGQPPSYPSQTGYGYYPRGYSQNPAAYPPQEGYASTGTYPSQGYPQGGGGNNYPQPQGYPQGGGENNYPQPQYYPPSANSNNNQAVIVTQNTQNAQVEPLKNYVCLAVFAIFMFLPTGIMALMKANEAQHEYHMGNVANAHASNRSARKFIKITVVLGVLLLYCLSSFQWC